MAGTGEEELSSAEAPGAAGGEAGREALQKRLAAAGGAWDGATAAALAGLELAEREEKGQGLFTSSLLGEVSEEFCLEASKLLGYGLWWTEEASWRIAEVHSFRADPPAGTPTAILLDCAMAADGDASRKDARVEMDVEADLAVRALRFLWK